MRYKLNKRPKGKNSIPIHPNFASSKTSRNVVAFAVGLYIFPFKQQFKKFALTLCSKIEFILLTLGMKAIYLIAWSICYLISLLPLRILYIFSDFTYFLLYYVVRYRKYIVKDNLRQSFPEKNDEWLLSTEKEFYHFFCDCIFETLKLFSIPNLKLKERMRFEGVAEMVNALEKENKQFAFIYLGHYGNWEWVSSLTARIHDVNPEVIGGHIYHPLYNKVADRLLKWIRGRSGGKNIPMKETLRWILNWKRNGEKVIIGFIADQNPKWSSIHHWTDFFHRKTPVFVGTERIGKQVDALVFYADVERVKRGYYRCKITRMAEDIKKYGDYDITDCYMQHLEQTIRRAPSYWLWTHNRWKRTYEEYLIRQEGNQ